MEGLFIIVALLVGALLAIGVSMAGLQLTLSFVSDSSNKHDSRGEEGDVQTVRT